MHVKLHPHIALTVLELLVFKHVHVVPDKLIAGLKACFHYSCALR